MAAEKQTSASVRPSTRLPYSSAVHQALAWVCTVPLGLPVEPDEYSQNAGSSPRVAAGSASGSLAARSESKAIAPAGSASATPATIRCLTSFFAWPIALPSSGASEAETIAAWARLCASM